VVVTRSMVLQLYRDLLRGSKTFQFSDVTFYRGRVREEFFKNKDLTEQRKVRMYYEYGLKMLKHKVGGIL